MVWTIEQAQAARQRTPHVERREAEGNFVMRSLNWMSRGVANIGLQLGREITENQRHLIIAGIVVGTAQWLWEGRVSVGMLVFSLAAGSSIANRIFRGDINVVDD